MVELDIFRVLVDSATRWFGRLVAEGFNTSQNEIPSGFFFKDDDCLNASCSGIANDPATLWYIKTTLHDSSQEITQIRSSDSKIINVRVL